MVESVSFSRNTESPPPALSGSDGCGPPFGRRWTLGVPWPALFDPWRRCLDPDRRTLPALDLLEARRRNGCSEKENPIYNIFKLSRQRLIKTGLFYPLQRYSSSFRCKLKKADLHKQTPTTHTAFRPAQGLAWLQSSFLQFSKGKWLHQTVYCCYFVLQQESPSKTFLGVKGCVLNFQRNVPMFLLSKKIPR